VQQEPSDELLRSHRHDLESIAVAPITPPEHYLPLTQRHQAVITQRHAMGIAAQVGEYVLRGGKGRLGIDDPRLLP
jgi:hypothetical protein